MFPTQTCRSSSQVIISTLCNRFARPLSSAVTPVANQTHRDSLRIVSLFTGFSPPFITSDLLISHLALQTHSWTVQPKRLCGLLTGKGPKTAQRGTRVHID